MLLRCTEQMELYHRLPPELWKVLGEFLNRNIVPTAEDSIVLVRPHPSYYEIMMDAEGNITEIKTCRPS